MRFGSTILLPLQLGILVSIGGCGGGGSGEFVPSAVEIAQTKAKSRLTASQAAQDELFAENDSADKKTPSEVGVQAAAFTPPFPDRQNPFEFAPGVNFNGPVIENENKSDVRLYGFIELDDAKKAVLNIAGQTRTLSAGQSWGGVDVLEVKPPEVRLRNLGVVRTISLLHPDGSSDTAGR